MMKLLPKKSKKGITLVESVIAVVVLAMFATGVLTLLTSGGVKIQEISNQSAVYAEATQKLDWAISAISNGAYISKDESTDSVSLKLTGDDGLNKELDAEVTATVSLYKTGEPETSDNVRGWYLTLKYGGVTVKGFASNSEGVFDS